MSQNPSGQQPPQYPQGYPQQPPHPQQYLQPYMPYQAPQVGAMMYAQPMHGGGQFSRAGMMLMITGCVMALCGVACGAMGFLPLEQMMAEATMDPQLQAIMTPQMMKIALFIMGGGSLLYAILAIGLGMAVRRGSKGATIGAIVLTSIVLAYLALNVLGGLAQLGRSPQALLGECVIFPALIVAIWQLVWLIQAVRSAPPQAAMQAQMQMQYWQMMQMQQQQQYQQMMAQQQQAQAKGDEGPKPPTQG